VEEERKKFNIGGIPYGRYEMGKQGIDANKTWN
jgi:hypothetical protein